MRKLMLKKEVVARIEHDEMHQLRGGYDEVVEIMLVGA